MNWLYKLERKFGKYATPYLIVYLIAVSAVGYVIENLAPTMFAYLVLSPYHILHGQVWRLFTWILMPTYSDLISMFFWSLLYFQLGTALERTWGTFRFNLYLISGMVFTVIGAFVLYGVQYLVNGTVTMEMLYSSYQYSMNYIFMSIFLAFAVTYPEMRILLMFIIPIKMKWMGAVYAALIIYQFILTGAAGKVCIAMSLISFIAFFLSTRNWQQYTPHEQKRKREFRAQVREPRAGSNIAKHKCAICGRTELDDPSLEFRYCSKCAGNYEYCMEHLFTHQHKRM